MFVTRKQCLIFIGMFLILAFFLGYYQHMPFHIIPMGLLSAFKQENYTNCNACTCDVLVKSHNESTKVMKKGTSELEDNENITYFITTFELRQGRLGNQMFKYAALLGIARSQRRHMFVPAGSELQNSFKLQFVFTNDGSKGTDKYLPSVISSVSIPSNKTVKNIKNISSNHNRKKRISTLSNKAKETNPVKSSSLYITSHILRQGRLGNQMFKYASLLGLARILGRQMFVEARSELQNNFQIHNVTSKHFAERWPSIKEDNPVAFDPKLLKLPHENMRIEGYLQSTLYFNNVFPEVRQEFTFHDSIANEAAEFLRTVYDKTNSTMFVGVHVRRGDFLIKQVQQWGYGVPQKSYFLKAFQWMKSMFPYRKITFLVASDDLPWCNQNLIESDIINMPPASPGVHLAVLSRCEHVIISGGTYGWWGGWLANGHVIYYKGYMGPDTPLGSLLDIKGYYPRLWIGMDN